MKVYRWIQTQDIVVPATVTGVISHFQDLVQWDKMCWLIFVYLGTVKHLKLQINSHDHISSVSL